MNIVSTWLTINRACNLSCKWCYAQKVNRDNNMDLNTAKRLVDISYDIGVKNIKLIGGEPTIYPYFFELLEYIMKYHIGITIVTNGIKLANKEFCKTLKKYNYFKINLGISIKGASDEDYMRDCGSRSYSLLLKGLKNCDVIGLNYSLSYVLTNENIKTLGIFANNIKNSGITKTIFMAYCNAVISEEDNTCNKLQLEMDYEFSKQYDIINEILDDRIKIHQTFPLCVCEPSTYNKLFSRKQIYTTCHVHKRNGLIFDTNGSILLCNHLAGYGIGELDIDFYDAKSFKRYWDSDYVVDIYNKFTSLPSKECQDCKLISKCGGGCFIQWFSQHFDEYKKYKLLNNKGVNNYVN